MTTIMNPRAAATAVAHDPHLPSGPDEAVTGFGVMGLPFSSGHYLSFRDFPSASFLPGAAGYRSVWHRDPDGAWTFYATSSPEQSCARYFSSATANAAVVCPIDVAWTSDLTLTVDIPEILTWTIGLRDTAATRLFSRVGSRLPESLWTNTGALGVLGRMAGPVLGAGRVRLAGTMPNGQHFRIAPKQLWAVDSARATLRGHDLGECMTTTIRTGAATRWMVIAYGLLCYLAFLASFGYAVFFVIGIVVPRTVDRGVAAPVASAIAANLALLGIFAAQHTVMARPWFKRWWTTIVPAAVERGTFVLAASAALGLLCWQWRTIDGTVWDIHQPIARAAVWTVAPVGWLTVLATTFMINHFELFGLQQVFAHWRGRRFTASSFRTPLLYRLHPGGHPDRGARPFRIAR